MSRWYVVDADGIQYGTAHPCEADAMCAMVALVHELSPYVENPYLVEPGDDSGPWAYAAPPNYTQNRRTSRG